MTRNSTKNTKLSYELLKIKQNVPTKDFRAYIEIVKNFIAIDTPEEFIFEALKDKLKTTQIRRLIDHELEVDRKARTVGLIRFINKQFPKEVVEQAKKLHAKETKKKFYLSQRKRIIKRAIANIEWRKICAETDAQRSKVKSRKKPKKTFWNVSATNQKYKTFKWKMK